MRQIIKVVVLLSLCMTGVFCSCCGKPDVTVSVDADAVISTDYIGNGVQWDPYALNYGKGPVEISEEDWQKIYSRLDFMRPAFIRVMLNTRDLMTDGRFDPEAGFDHLSHILDYCQSREVTVMFGDWGWGQIDAKAETINEPLLRNAAEYVGFLVNNKGYDCIKYYNLVNEPNGYWSSSDGKYDLWLAAVRFFWAQMEGLGLDSKVRMAGPDVAIWSSAEAWWVTNTARDLGDAVGVYDIHTYPSKCTVNSGEYGEILKAYKDQVPEGARIVMGEIGFKFVEKEDSLYLADNNRRIAEVPHASAGDSQMFVYEHMYGTDMADAVFQTVNAGYSGCIAWMLDDAMHYNESPDKLKIWGFWNIFGEEYFGAEHEAVRPWFYAWSLICRYIPQGSVICKVSVEGRKDVKAMASVHDGARTLALVNVGKAEATVSVSSSDFGMMNDATKYVYGEGQYRTQGDCMILPEAEGLRIDTKKGVRIVLPAETMVLITEKRY